MTNKPVLSASNINKSFNGQKVLDGVSLELRCGEIVLLRGDNGSGKTTLLNILTGNLEPDAGVIGIFNNCSPEHFRFPRRWLEKLNPFDHFSPERVAVNGVGRSWQEIRLFPTHSLQDNLALAAPHQSGENPVWSLFRRLAVKKQEKDILDCAGRMLAKLGLAGRENSSADKISLGQSKRVAIARAVMAGARVLFLDEPLAGLDEEGVTEVLGFLKRLAVDEQITLVIVEHIFNVPRLLDLVTTVWTLDSGNLFVDDVHQIRKDYECSSIQDPSHSSVRKLAGVHCHTASEQELPGGALLTKLTCKESGDVGAPILEVRDIVVCRGKRIVIGKQIADGSVQGLSFCLSMGELAVLHAPNGWGKTTLFEAIAGLIPVTSGSIFFNGNPIQCLTPWERVRIGMSLLQSRNQTFSGLTIRESLRLSRLAEIPSPISNLADKHCSHLSGGEKQKLAIWSVINGKGFSLGLFDEPFYALDAGSINRICETTELLLRNGSSLFVAVPRMLMATAKAAKHPFQLSTESLQL